MVLVDRDRQALLSARALLPTVAATCGTAEELPLRGGSVGAISCSNFLRHCRNNWERVGGECIRVMSCGALFVVLEDDEQDDEPSARNYRDTLHLLAAVDSTRGPAMLPAELERLCTPRFGEAILAGSCQNELEIDDAQLPLRWLSARDLSPRERQQLEELLERVDLHGMSYGRYFYRVYRPGDACAA